ncbi:DEKNAAC101677 [Brettanomyces naardenensis]|uniref:Delta(14)-sterol reductase n=1 Tax=Brettanomyces naardenensis TaxID=13370 RepID=A0A448YIW0_BRENA|nr:DEKNAAC101677 [Brettanomyces naardenensis]
MSTLNPKTTQRDFFGATGASIITVLLPLVVLGLYLCSNEQYHLVGVNLDVSKIVEIFDDVFIANWRNIFLNATCWKVYSVWFFSLAVLDLIVPGYWKQGVELRDGTRLWYLINGKELSLALFAILGARSYVYGGLRLPELTFLYDNFLPLMVTSWEFAHSLATLCYIFSFVPSFKPNGTGTNERILATGGKSGNPIFDWFIGRELNPRIGYWDIKLYCELRPGMLLWFLLNLACLQIQYLKLGYVTNSMILVNLLQAFYIFDGVLNEEGCLTMIDITSDGFGFMLAFGDLCWVPFSYSLQARYLSLVEVNLPVWAVVGIVSVMTLGFWIFKSSNNQKSKFRQGKLPDMNSIQTDRGTKLLVDGWWGMAQHINYFGDILMALSWCLPTGFNTPLTYFYVIYFSCLLLHRQTRDEEKCSKKYGKYWKQYEKEVPWKIIPYIY